MNKVLIVEDNPADAEVLFDALKETLPDAEVLIADDGDIALELIGQHKFDVVFLDLNMPRVTGFEVLEQLSKGPVGINQLPIVITTTDTESSRTVFSLFEFRLGIYMVKPLDLSEYAHSVEWVMTVLRNYRAAPASILRSSYEQRQ